MVLSSEKNNVYALTKDDFISVSIEMPKVKPIQKTAPVEINEPSPVESKEIDVGELFSDVWTKKIVPKKKKKPKKNKRLQEALKNTNLIKKKKHTQTPSKEIQKSTSSGDEVNEYLAKIQALVYDNFHPPKNSQGHSVKAVIDIDGAGKVKDFRILRYSENKLLNDECDLIKNRLKTVMFPVNPDNKSGSYIIILTAKE